MFTQFSHISSCSWVANSNLEEPQDIRLAHLLLAND